MLNFRERSKEAEILDDFAVGEEELAKNAAELRLANVLLGGHRSLRLGLDALPLDKSKSLLLCDLGCGTGDQLAYCAQYLRGKGYSLRALGVDASADMVALARKKYPNLEFTACFLEDFEPPHGTDQVLLVFNLFLHHLEDHSIESELRRLHAAGANILISDLHRSKLAYLGFQLFSKLLRFSPIGHADGLLSIKKGFTTADWERLLASFSKKQWSITWNWLFRYLVLIPAKGADRPASK